MASSSVIIRDFYIPGVPLFPPEAHPILIVDADAVLTLSIALQLLQTISWWVSEIVNFCCEVQCLKLADGDSGNLPQLAAMASQPEASGLVIRKGPDHRFSVAR